MAEDCPAASSILPVRDSHCWTGVVCGLHLDYPGGPFDCRRCYSGTRRCARIHAVVSGDFSAQCPFQRLRLVSGAVAEVEVSWAATSRETGVHCVSVRRNAGEVLGARHGTRTRTGAEVMK